MSTPAMIYLLLVAFAIGVVLGKESESPTRASLGAIAWVTLCHALMAGLLYWGGFFAKVAP